MRRGERVIETMEGEKTWPQIFDEVLYGKENAER